MMRKKIWKMAALFMAVGLTTTELTTTFAAQTTKGEVRVQTADQSSEKDISNMSIMALRPFYTFTGEKIEPLIRIITNLTEEKNNGDGTITVMDYYILLKEGKDYSVTYQNQTKIGTATAIVKGIGDYEGKKTLTYEIVPQTPVMKKLKASKKAVTVQMDKVAGGCSYQIAYKQSGRKKWNYTTSKTTNKKISHLQAGKTYALKVRAYKKVDGHCYRGAWSNVEKIKVH